MAREFTPTATDFERSHQQARPSWSVRPTLSVRIVLRQISLLLNLNPDRHIDCAGSPEQEPKNPDYAATYAFSLHLHGDVKKALHALAGFSEVEWNGRDCRVYRGLTGEQWRFVARGEIS